MDTEPNVITPDIAKWNIAHDNKNYTLSIDKNNIVALQELQATQKPRTYDELLAIESKERQEFESIKNQYERLLDKRQELRKEQYVNPIQRQMIMEKIETKGALNNPLQVNGILKHFRQLNTKDITNFLKEIPATPQPTKLTTQEIEKLIQQFNNVDNLKEHLSTRANPKNRQDIFNLLETTIQDPHIHYIKDNKDKRLKHFIDNDNKQEYYIVITKDNDKTFITHFTTKDYNYIAKEIKGADEIIDTHIIRDFRERTGSTKSVNPKPQDNTTTQKQIIPYNILNMQNINDYITYRNNILHALNPQNIKLLANNTKENVSEAIKALEKIQEKYNITPQDSNNLITYRSLRPTIIQSEKMQNPIHAEFAIIDIKDLHPSFTSGKGYQFRNIKQDYKIQDIQENLRPDIIYQEGSFAGVPIIDKYGKVIAGNHRATGLKSLNQQSRATLKQAIKDKFNYDLQDNEIVVRRVASSHNEKDLITLAKASNDGLENRLSEAIYTKIAKYKDKLDKLPKHLNDDSMDILQESVMTTLGANATNKVEANLALLTHKIPNPHNFEKALNEIEKKGNDIKIQNMLLDNAGSFHNLNNAIPQVKIYDLLDGGITILSNAHYNTRNNIKGLNDRMRDYINTPKESLEYTEQILGNSPDTFKKIAFGYALNKISLQNTNPSDYVFTKIKDFMQEAEELKQGSLFGEGREVNSYDFIKHLLGNALDSTNQDFRKLFTQIEELEAKRNIEPLTNTHIQAQTKEEAKELTHILSNEIYNAKRDLLQLESQKTQGIQPQAQKNIQETKNAIIETQTKDNKTIKTIVYNKKKDSLTINQHNEDDTITKLTQDNINIVTNTKDLHELLHTQDPFIAKIKREGKLENDTTKANANEVTLVKDQIPQELQEAKTKDVNKYLYKHLENILGKELRNKEGFKAKISKNSIHKMTSDRAIQKSINNRFSRKDHLEAVANIQNIFENSTLKESKADKNNNPNLIIHRLTSDFKEAQALLTVKESNTHGNKLYSIELELRPNSQGFSTPTNTKTELGSQISLQETEGKALNKAESPIEKTDKTDSTTESKTQDYKGKI